jgi:thiamine pyrophosphate-dependent acetolactate synthase large subunit-like protein
MIMMNGSMIDGVERPAGHGDERPAFFNDEVHQERVARARERAVDNRWIGQHIREPEPDLAALARSLGLQGIGPVREADALLATLAEAVAAARDGAAVLVDVHVDSGGYPGGPANTSQDD